MECGLKGHVVFGGNEQVVEEVDGIRDDLSASDEAFDGKVGERRIATAMVNDSGSSARELALEAGARK